MCWEVRRNQGIGFGKGTCGGLCSSSSPPQSSHSPVADKTRAPPHAQPYQHTDTVVELSRVLKAFQRYSNDPQIMELKAIMKVEIEQRLADCGIMKEAVVLDDGEVQLDDSRFDTYAEELQCFSVDDKEERSVDESRAEVPALLLSKCSTCMQIATEAIKCGIKKEAFVGDDGEVKLDDSRFDAYADEYLAYEKRGLEIIIAKDLQQLVELHRLSVDKKKERSVRRITCRGACLRDVQVPHAHAERDGGHDLWHHEGGHCFRRRRGPV